MRRIWTFVRAQDPVSRHRRARLGRALVSAYVLVNGMLSLRTEDVEAFVGDLPYAALATFMSVRWYVTTRRERSAAAGPTQ